MQGDPGDMFILLCPFKLFGGVRCLLLRLIHGRSFILDTVFLFVIFLVG